MNTIKEMLTYLSSAIGCFVLTFAMAIFLCALLNIDAVSSAFLTGLTGGVVTTILLIFMFNKQEKSK